MLVKGNRLRRKELEIAAMKPPAPLMVYKSVNPLNGHVNFSQNWNGTGSPMNLHFKETSDEIHPGPPFKNGGPFASIEVHVPRRVLAGHTTQVSKVSLTEELRIEGAFAYPDLSRDPDVSNYSSFGLGTGANVSAFPNLSPWGPRAYARLRPQLEKAGMSVFLAEARDIPRMLRTTAKGFHDIWKGLGGKSHSSWSQQPKKVADHFLNNQFGWVPFVNDLVKFNDVVTNSQKYIDQLEKDNNQWVRRTRTMAHTEESVKVDSVLGLGCEPVKFEMADFMPFGATGPRWDVHVETTSLIWATGSFKYYRPEFDTSLPSHDSAWDTSQRYLTLLGARVNPSNVYKATPWTWLIDWFSNVGDNVDLANDIVQDSVVSKYMYVMQTRTVHCRSYHYVPWFSGPRVHTWDRFITTKQRQSASSSFGFDLSPDALTLRQIAILGALGVSRT